MIFTLAMGLFSVFQPAVAQVTLNLKNADINALIQSISEITNRNFIVDPRVRGQVSVISSKPMNEDEIYQVFLSILAVHGFTAIPGEQVTKIVPLADAKQMDVPTIEQLASGDATDQIVTRVIPVENVSAAQVVPILRPLIPAQGHLAAYAPTNVLIISDRAGNVERLADIISRIDTASDAEVEIVSLRYASATDVVRTLTALEQAKGASGQAPASAPAQMVADERTNSILLSGDQTSRLRLRTLITHLDTPLTREGNTQVIYLRYARAAELVNVLTGVSEQLVDNQQQDSPPDDGAPPPPVQGAQNDRNIDIQADEATNSLVITASPSAIRSLRSVISQLDVRRAQVLVEAAIAEVSSENTAELGVQWVADGTEGGNLVGFTNFTLGTSLAGVAETALAIAAGEIPSAGSVPPGLNVGVGDLRGSTRFAALVSALAADSDNNVLSTPTLVTLDNEEAEIVVGENRPFLTGSFTTTADGANNPFQTIERQDVALTLQIKPQINEGNAVQLEIVQEIQNVLENTPQGPVTSKRNIKTNVLVEDGQILVLGGLIDDQLNESIQKVPGLGDIPLLGNLFRYRNTTKRKQNLMIFLHPVILRGGIQEAMYTNDKYNYIRQQQLDARQKGVGLLPNAQTPLLKPREDVEKQKSLLELQQSEPPPEPVEENKPFKRRHSGFKNK
jgi:general secretion pathway protein D